MPPKTDWAAEVDSATQSQALRGLIDTPGQSYQLAGKCWFSHVTPGFQSVSAPSRLSSNAQT
jgi:hypothetical protein